MKFGGGALQPLYLLICIPCAMPPCTDLPHDCHPSCVTFFKQWDVTHCAIFACALEKCKGISTCAIAMRGPCPWPQAEARRNKEQSKFFPVVHSNRILVDSQMNCIHVSGLSQDPQSCRAARLDV